MKLPINGAWLVEQNSNRGLALFATKNMQFDDRGYATLANRTADCFDEASSANFRVPLVVFQNPAPVKEVGNGNAPYSFGLDTLPFTLSIDALSNQPTGSANTSQAYFNSKWFVSMSNDIRSFNGSAWTDESVTITSGVRHPMCVHRGNNTLLVGNGAQVKQFNTSVSETTNLTLPAGVEVVGIAYNRNFAAIITWNATNQEAWLYIWDGGTAAANYSYPLGSNRAFFIAPYKDTFVTINGLGQILKWDTDGLSTLGALPSYFTSAILGDIDDRSDVAHDTAILIDGERILFNISSLCSYKNSEPSDYILTMPSGIWCWDPAIGLYHRHAPSGAKLNTQSIAAANVNAGTDIITGTSIPATGTPFVYASLDGVSIGGLTENTIYYVINQSATTFKVAATRALALAGTAINITSAASGAAYGFAFFPESDFGQLLTDGYAGILTNTGPSSRNTDTAFFSLFQKFLYGFTEVPHNFVSDDSDTLGIVMDRSENRGYIVTQRMFTPNVEEKFQKLYVKSRNLVGENDAIIVKYRSKEDSGMPIYAADDTAKYGTWSILGAAASTFTTTVDLTAVKTAFDLGNAYEIEIIAGAGSGYLAHITAIAVNAGTWTVSIDEPIRNAAVSNTFNFVIDNWLKLKTKDEASAITSATNPDYAEFPLGTLPTKWIQFKLELRGFKVALEELEIVNTGFKGAL